MSKADAITQNNLDLMKSLIVALMVTAFGIIGYLFVSYESMSYGKMAFVFAGLFFVLCGLAACIAYYAVLIKKLGGEDG